MRNELRMQKKKNDENYSRRDKIFDIDSFLIHSSF